MSKIGSSTTKFEVEKFNGKENFSLWQKKGEGVTGAIRSSQDLAGQVSKICRYVKRGLRGDDLKAASTIQLYLADEVMYNVMDEETATGLWSMLECCI